MWRNAFQAALDVWGSLKCLGDTGSRGLPLLVIASETPALEKPTKGKGSLKADLSCCFGFIETRFACFQAAYAARRDDVAAVRLFKAA